jgi:hypothetical protein
LFDRGLLSFQTDWEQAKNSEQAKGGDSKRESDFHERKTRAGSRGHRR